MASFAGSQRGDRRRRRLAADTDDQAARRVGHGDTIDGTVLGQRVDAAHAQEAAAENSSLTVPSLMLPVAAIVPVGWWKYWAAGLACLVLGAGTVAGGHYAEGWIASVGPEIAGLFALPEAPLARWYSSLLLFVSAQLACLIWWARSRSANDFNGRYWLWVRIACLWLALSGALATGAQTALVAAAHRISPAAPSWLTELVPMLAFGGWVVRALSREMGGCRASRGMLYAAATAYLAAVALGLDRDPIVPAGSRPAFIQAMLLLGHIGLFLSMWLHARHVVHCTADPAKLPARRWRLPRPHLNLARWRIPRVDRSPDDQPETPEKRTLPEGHKEPAEQVPTGAARETAGARPEQRPSKSRAAPKPKFRIDAGHEEFLGSGADAESSSNARPASEKGVPAVQEQEEPVRDALHDTEDPAAIEPPVSQIDAAARESSVDEAGGGDRDEEAHSKPDLRGLSKKQRRRLMQEHRQRERELGH